MTVVRDGDYFNKTLASMNPQKRVNIVVGSRSLNYLQ